MISKITRVFPNQKKTYIILFLITITIFMITIQTSKYKYRHQLLSSPTIRKTIKKSHTDSIQCFNIKSDSLPDISDSRPSKGKSIFFHETSCDSYLNDKITINARQACAVESAAKLNPNFDVYVLYASPGLFKFEGTESDRLLQALFTYDNIQIKHVDYGRYTKGTPVEKLYSEGKIEKSKYPQSHASDVLRYLSLWKYGGIYLDLDVIVIKPLELVPLNYAGYQDRSTVGAGVLSFGPDGPGHVLAGKCLEELKNNFKGYLWGNNGPGVVTRLVNKLCKDKRISNTTYRACNSFKVFSQEVFYPISYWNWRMYFNEGDNQKVLKKLENSYVIHVWNKLSVNEKVVVNGNSTYAILARKFCPKVVEQCSIFFLIQDV